MRLPLDTPCMDGSPFSVNIFCKKDKKLVIKNCVALFNCSKTSDKQIMIIALIFLFPISYFYIK